MSNPYISAETLAKIIAFRDDRNWRQFHNPKDLALSLSLEASELLECFQWSAEAVDVPEKRAHMAEELADVLIYAAMFADITGINMDQAIQEKLVKNTIKYPLPTNSETS